MGYSDGLITETNVSIKDVKDVLEASSYDLGTLCTYSKINIWAKFKPVRLDSQWGKGDFGLSIKSSTKMSDIAAAIDGSMNGWTYDRPNNTSGYKLGHFRKYWHKAPNPIAGWDCTTTASNIAGSKMAAWIDDTNLAGTYNVGLEEFQSLKDCYLGVCLQNTSKTDVFWYQTSTTTMSVEREFGVEVDTSGLAAGTYNAFLFISTTTQKPGSTQPATFYTIPYLTKKAVTITDQQVSSWYANANAYITKVGNTYTLEYEVYVKNNGTSTLPTISGISCTLMRRTSSQGQGAGTVIATICDNQSISGVQSGKTGIVVSGSKTLTGINESYVYEVATKATGSTTRYETIGIEADM